MISRKTQADRRSPGQDFLRTSTHTLRTCLLALLFCCAWAGAARAQIETGTIVGTVTDASASVVPGVKVEIRSAATGVVMTVTTNEAGRYQSPPLKPDSYEVTATAQGFKTSRV